jgi:hypothetical protein
MKILLIIFVIGYFMTITWHATTYTITKRIQNALSFSLMLICIWGWAYMLHIITQIERNSKRYEFRQEIKVKSLNGIETSRDTLFIISLKKK